MAEGYALIEISQFYRELLVCIGDKDMVRKCITKYHDDMTAEEMCNAIIEVECGKTIYDDQKNLFLLWLPHSPKTAQDMGFLSHEIFHAACAVMDAIGSKPSEDSEEVYAYLITFLTQKIIETFSISFSSCQEPESEQTQQVASQPLKTLDSEEPSPQAKPP